MNTASDRRKAEAKNAAADAGRGCVPEPPEPSTLLLVLSRIFDYLNTNIYLPPEEIFDYVLRRIIDLLDAKAGNIRLYDGKTKKLVLRASYGVSKKYRNSKAALEVRDSVAGLVYSGGRVYMAEDLRENSLYRMPEYTIKEGILSLICLPLTAHGKKLGVLSIYFKNVKKFSAQEEEFFSVLVKFLAGFIANRVLEYNLRKSSLDLAKVLVAIMDEKDVYTKGHSERVSENALKIAKKLKLGKRDMHVLNEYGILHDIGKIIIDSAVLNKKGKLTEKEWAAIREHPAVGARVINPVGEFVPSLPLVKHHHERVDGGGYPEGLNGKKIPMLAKIVAVADAFDAMVSNRAYRNAMTFEAARQELLKNIGKQFDAEAVRAMVELIDAGEIDPP